jgi:hypothetical protein
VVLAGVIVVHSRFPVLGHRIVSWPIFLMLLLTAMSSHVVQSMALYLRAHKCEPFVFQSIVIAVMTASGVFVVAPRFGTVGVCGVYFLVLGVAGICSATVIFQKKRREWHEV